MQPPVQRAVIVNLPPCGECGARAWQLHAAACTIGRALAERIRQSIEAAPWWEK